MPVFMVIAIIAVLVAVVYLAAGRGGEMSAERNDYAPLDLGPVSATDIALLRPPTGLWGYNVQTTNEALDQIAESIRERDVRIVALEQLVTDLSRDHAPMPLLSSPYAGARHRRAAADTVGAETVQAAHEVQKTEPAWASPEPPVTEPTWASSAPPATESAWVPPEPSTTESAWAPLEAPESEPARPSREVQAPDPGPPPFEPPRPSGKLPGPPERSHD